MSKYKVIFYEEDNGKRPVEEFLLKSDIKMRAKLSGLIKVLSEKGNELREPYSKALGEELAKKIYIERVADR